MGYSAPDQVKVPVCVASACVPRAGQGLLATARPPMRRVSPQKEERCAQDMVCVSVVCASARMMLRDDTLADTVRNVRPVWEDVLSSSIVSNVKFTRQDLYLKTNVPRTVAWHLHLLSSRK
uniref:Uncharacterized protein n=1 Tax=Cacopsylla melanoneura TaxID=428564 RepID=A0A8D8TA95_9HEMI